MCIRDRYNSDTERELCRKAVRLIYENLLKVYENGSDIEARQKMQQAAFYASFGGGDEVELPDYLREEAGIPEKAKLCASVDEEEHTVTISEADYNHDLRDVPEEVLEMFRGAEVCVGELEERLILGDVVYGN